MVPNKIWYDLRNAVLSRQFELALELMRMNPQLIDERNSIGETVLHFLAVENDLEGVAWLHGKGFSLDVRNRFGTPRVFEVASLDGRFDTRALLIWLVEHSADFSLHDRKGRNLLEYLSRPRDEGRMRRAEETACFLKLRVPALRDGRLS